ncbi:MAG: hypothetical protein BRC30_03260 [Nanohaloarchaea archaeon SW_7_46_7]|nr:MAG: hypothetical protein BRC30_03260 [Nanohaloarchaea archaeon SW_7_46_7]
MLSRALLTLLFFSVYVVVQPGILPQEVPFVDGVNSTKLDNFQEKEVEIDSLRENPEGYFNETVVVSGKPDLALAKKDTYVVHSLFNRSNFVYFRGCEEVSTTADKVYVRGEFRNMTEEAFMDRGNISEEQEENIETARKALEDYNYSTEAYEPSNFPGISCEEVIERN